MLNKGPSDAPTLAGPSHEEATEVPKVLDQYDPNNVITEYCHQVNAFRWPLKPDIHIRIDVFDHRCSMLRPYSALNDRSHEITNGLDFIRGSCANK